MNTNVCLVFLMAIGLSTLNAEFEVDFKKMVKKVKLDDGKTLLDCPENCDKQKGTACQCVHFDPSMSSDVENFIKTGLHKLNINSSREMTLVIKRLKQRVLNKTLTDEDRTQWRNPVSPKLFLNYIQELYQISNAQR